jgi:hypothetical protein
MHSLVADVLRGRKGRGYQLQIESLRNARYGADTETLGVELMRLSEAASRLGVHPDTLRTRVGCHLPGWGASVVSVRLISIRALGVVVAPAAGRVNSDLA